MLKNSAKIKLFLVASKFFHSFFFSCNFLLLYSHFEKRILRIFCLYVLYGCDFHRWLHIFLFYILLKNKWLKWFSILFPLWNSVESVGKYDFTYIELVSIKKLFTFSLANYHFFCNLPPSIENIWTISFLFCEYSTFFNKSLFKNNSNNGIVSFSKEISIQVQLFGS